MDFLAPVFAAIGLAAASIPVVLHMLRRAPTQQMPFSLVRFLKPSRPTLTKRSSIEHWPLMLLRILALVLIGLAFARPFLREVIPIEQQDGEVQSITILVDKSASMRRDGIYEKVQTAIREVARDVGDQDLLSIVEFSDSSVRRVSRESWASATTDERAAIVEGIVENYQPDWLGTDTGTAMRMAADELAQENTGRTNISRRRLVVVTDFQRGSDLDELKRGDWPASVEVELKPVEPTKKGNVGVAFVKDRRTDRIRVRVTSAGDTVQQEFRLQPFDATGAPVGEAVTITVAPGQRQSLILPAADPAAGKVIVGVELQGDDHPFDNIIDLPEVENPTVKVAHVGPSSLNDAESMRYYLQRVLDGNSERDVRLIDLVKDDGVILPIPADVRLLVATDIIPEGLQKSLSEFFARSGTLLMAPPSVDAVMSLRTFLPQHFDAKEAVVEDYAMLGQIDFEHPLFSSFADARFADFSSIRFWHHRNLIFPEEDRKPGDWSIVAKFDDGLPAIVDLRVADTGRLMLLATGWHPVDSQLALSTRFPPLMTRILSLASPAQKDQLVQTVGDVIRPQDVVSSEHWKVQRPDGSVLSSEGSELTGGDELQSPESKSADTLTLTDPGRYVVTGTTEDGDQAVTLIAGLAAAESRTEMLPIGQLQVLGIGATSPVLTDHGTDPSTDEATGQLSAVELERTQKWWRWLLLAGLACLFVESVWASRIAKRQIENAS